MPPDSRDGTPSNAPILCCTAEFLANIALREGAAANVPDVLMDEFPYYADRERGVAWQVPLLTMPQTLSAGLLTINYRLKLLSTCCEALQSHRRDEREPGDRAGE